jgi:hypothetical protein
VFSPVYVYRGSADGKRGAPGAEIWTGVFSDMRIIYRNGIRNITRKAAVKAVRKVVFPAFLTFDQRNTLFISNLLYGFSLA